jgi:hypothetical protein
MGAGSDGVGGLSGTAAAVCCRSGLQRGHLGSRRVQDGCIWEAIDSQRGS